MRIQLAQKTKNALFIAGCALVVIFSVFNTFNGLADIPIHDWDEARHGISAYEMYKSGDYIINTYLGETDYYNLKPPLSFWAISAGYAIFGVGTFGFRFFSAVCLPIIVLVFILFFRKHFGPVFALGGGLLFSLICVQMHHLFTRGDADALFYLFTFLSIIFFIESYLTSDKNLIGVGICTAFAFLAKAAHIAIFAFSMFVCMIILLKVLRFSLKHLLLYGLLPFLVLILPWFIWRYLTDGALFFQQMLIFDVIERTVVGVDGNVRGPLYYIGSLYVIFGPVVLILFAALVCACLYVCFKYRDQFELRDKAFVFLNLLVVLVPLVFFTIIPTKVPWYIWPSTMGVVALAAWLPHFLWRIRASFNERKYKVINNGGYSAIIAVLFAIGLLLMPERYVSPNMAPVIFDDLPKASEQHYFVTDTDGYQYMLSQSSILGGIFSGYIFQYGDIGAFRQAEDALLVLKYPDSIARADFISANADLMLEYDDGDGTAVYILQK